jgi:hypothetical protein
VEEEIVLTEEDNIKIQEISDQVFDKKLQEICD